MVLYGLQHISANPPPIGLVKIDTDGAVGGNGIAAAGGLIRDHNGNLFGGVSKKHWLLYGFSS